jgi:UDP-glucose 4-epimerase
MTPGEEGDTMTLNTVAVFGASGKIGSHIMPLLQDRGVAVRALVHQTPLRPARAGLKTGPSVRQTTKGADEVEGVECITGSITDQEAVREVVAGADAVIQLATTKEDPDTFFEVSVRGTLNVLEACRDADLQQFILFGGDASFGIWFYPQPIPIDENHRLMAYPGYYAFTKVLEEVMVEQYHYQYGLPYTIQRCSWIFERDDLLGHFSLLENVDPAEPGHGFGEQPPEIMALVERGEERIPIQVNADGVPYHRHIVHIDDVMQAFDRILGNEAALGHSFNIAGPAAFNYRPAAEYLSDKTGIPTIEIACAGYHSFEINIARARSMLGYAPENDIFTMIDRALQYRESAG